MMVSRNTGEDFHLRNWMDDHPKTSLYIAVMVTIIFVLQVLEVLRLFN